MVVLCCSSFQHVQDQGPVVLSLILTPLRKLETALLYIRAGNVHLVSLVLSEILSRGRHAKISRPQLNWIWRKCGTGSGLCPNTGHLTVLMEENPPMSQDAVYGKHIFPVGIYWQRKRIPSQQKQSCAMHGGSMKYLKGAFRPSVVGEQFTSKLILELCKSRQFMGKKTLNVMLQFSISETGKLRPLFLADIVFHVLYGASTLV